MDRKTAAVLVRNVLARLQADATNVPPVFGALVSPEEREALMLSFGEIAGIELPTIDSPPEVDAVGASTSAQVVASAARPSIEVKLDETCLSLKEPTDPDYVLCLDFGTARSKAFAASVDEEAPQLLELALGKRDGARDGAVYAVSSSVWIDDDGLMFPGSEAVRLGILRAQAGAGGRRRLDSLKQELSQIQSAHDVSRSCSNRT